MASRDGKGEERVETKTARRVAWRPMELSMPRKTIFAILGLPFQARLCLLHGPYLSAFLLEIGNIVPFDISNLVPWFWVQ